jgi:glycosyltransferase involved in cell wall biosynthesis
MRILVATDSWFPDVRGGSGRVAAETSRRLAARGHDVTVLAPVAAGATIEVNGRLTVVRCLRRSALPQVLTDTISARWGHRLRDRFDLFVAHQATVAAGLAAVRQGVPLAIVYHASTMREALLRSKTRASRRDAWSDRALASFVARVERSAVRRASRILVLSEYSRSLVCHDHPDACTRVRVTRGGVDTDRFSPGSGKEAARSTLGVPQEQTVLFAVRRLEPQLGLEALVRAFRLLPPQTRLVVAGDGRLAPRLRRLAAELEVAERMQLVGAPGEERLRLWYRAADVFVLPPAPHEGFGMATLEALASGTPAVAAPVGANPELLTPLEPRLLARSARSVDLAAAIGEALELTGPPLRQRCADYASERFAWQQVIETWEDELVETARSAE